MKAWQLNQIKNQTTSIELDRMKNWVEKFKRIAYLSFGIGFTSRIIHDTWYPARWLEGIVWVSGGAFIFGEPFACLGRCDKNYWFVNHS